MIENKKLDITESKMDDCIFHITYDYDEHHELNTHDINHLNKRNYRKHCNFRKIHFESDFDLGISIGGFEL